MKFLISFLDKYFSGKCFCCKDFGGYLCNNCFYKNKIKIYNCFDCIDKENGTFSKTCKKCRENIILDGVFSLFSYHNKDIKRIIYCFKYKYAFRIGIFFGRKMANLLRSFKVYYNNYVVIPVPMSNAGLNRRGFNQSLILGKEISNMLKIPLYDNILYKHKVASRQEILNENERHDNLKNVFYIDSDNFMSEKLNGKNVLLIDDIITTGNTASFCTKVLKLSGIKKVFVVTIART